MNLDAAGGVHLTYCANIHPGESWEDTFDSLQRHVPAVKAAVSPDAPFGLGLRLSALAAEGLHRAAAIATLRAFLDAEDLYVFTVNAFPFGQFHDTRVKENVYLPDWRDPARLVYTDRVADILAALLPDGIAGSISTVPGGFRGHIRDGAAVLRVADGLVDAAAHLADIERRTGRTIRLALEPEPHCMLETVEETVRFFEDHLFSRGAATRMARLAGGSEQQGLDLIRRHVGVCFDVCHAAVEYEDEDALDRLHAAGIAVPKIQLSSALRIASVDRSTRGRLEPFDDGVYLHQVVERGPDGLRRFADLDEAFAAIDAAQGREWRVHFHVPIFREDLDGFATTQGDLKAVLGRQRARADTAHLEVETYTWSVLPQAYRKDGLSADIARELQWVRRELAG